MLGQVLQAGRDANTHLHQDRVVVERMARVVEEESREQEDSAWKKETASGVRPEGEMFGESKSSW